jgi:hypothetical protein
MWQLILHEQLRLLWNKSRYSFAEDRTQKRSLLIAVMNCRVPYEGDFFATRCALQQATGTCIGLAAKLHSAQQWAVHPAAIVLRLSGDARRHLTVAYVASTKLSRAGRTVLYSLDHFC